MNALLTPCLSFTVSGLMALKKAAIAVPLMTPLIVITVLFNAYIREEHFRVAEYLPSRESMNADLDNGVNFSLAFLKGAYLQEELREKFSLPDNLEPERAQVLQLGQVSTEYETVALN